MLCFVTGADGFIGSHLCERLRDDGHDVVGLALYNSFDSFGWLDEVEGVEKVRGDVRDNNGIQRCIGSVKPQVIFHLAALNSVPHSFDWPECHWATNRAGGINIVNAASKYRCKLITASTSEVYGTAKYIPINEKHPTNPQSPYAVSKAHFDARCVAYKKQIRNGDVVIVRPFNTYGPRQSERAVVGSICRQLVDPGCKSIVLGDRSPIRDMVYVTDTVDAFVRAMDLDEPGPFNVCTGKGHTIGDIEKMLCDVSGIISKLPESDMQRVRPKDKEVRKLIGTAEKFEKATGWKPKVPLALGLKMTFDWWQGRKLRRDAGYMI
jgi:UDP-glucose 4-epimerase